MPTVGITKEVIMNQTDICNMALAGLAKQAIISIDDNHEVARQCKIYYDHCRRMILKDYQWGFAKRIDKLALMKERYPGYDYLYGYPSKCIAIRSVFEEMQARRKDIICNEYEVVIVSDNGRAIATDVPEAYAEITYDVTDAAIFSPEFCDALAHLIASNIAFVATGNMSVKEMEYQLYHNAMQKARTASAQEMEQKIKEKSNYANARFS